MIVDIFDRIEIFQFNINNNNLFNVKLYENFKVQFISIEVIVSLLNVNVINDYKTLLDQYRYMQL